MGGDKRRLLQVVNFTNYPSEKENTDIVINLKFQLSSATYVVKIPLRCYCFENNYVIRWLCLLLLPAVKNDWQESCVNVGCLRKFETSDKICTNCTFIRRLISTMTPTKNNIAAMNIMAPTATSWWITWVALIKPLKQEKIGVTYSLY